MKEKISIPEESEASRIRRKMENKEPLTLEEQKKLNEWREEDTEERKGGLYGQNR